MAEASCQQINHIIKAIIRAPGEDWTTERLAGLAGISAFHFHRLFRALTGETMFAFLQPEYRQRRPPLPPPLARVRTQDKLPSPVEIREANVNHPKEVSPEQLKTEIWIPIE